MENRNKKVYLFGIFSSLIPLLLFIYESNHYCQAMLTTLENEVTTKIVIDPGQVKNNTRTSPVRKKKKRGKITKMKTPPIIIPANEEHNATIIFMHGTGQTGHVWSTTFQDITPSYMKIICPNANKIPVTYKHGDSYPAWFDFNGAHPQARQDAIGIQKATDYVHTYLIETEMKKGIRPERIIIGGSGQGAALAIHAALTFPHRLAGILALSVYIPMVDDLAKYIDPVNKDIPILQSHTDNENIVSDSLATFVTRKLAEVSKNVIARKYFSKAPQDQMRDMEEFLKNCTTSSV